MSDGELLYQEFAPPPPLDAIVHRVWRLRGSSAEAAAQTIVPDGRCEIVLHLGEPFAARDPSGAMHVQPTALFAGQLTGPLHLAPRGEADILGIRFHPAGASALISVPQSELAERVIPLEELIPGLAGALAAIVVAPVDARVWPAALARTLSGFVRKEPSPLVAAAVGALERTALTRIDGLGRRLGVTTRTLERRVAETVGLSPATLRKVVRFRRVFRGLSESRRGTWARVAAAAGYFDQAHLIRDFRRFAGSAPSEFFGAESDLARAFLGSDQSAA